MKKKINILFLRQDKIVVYVVVISNSHNSHFFYVNIIDFNIHHEVVDSLGEHPVWCVNFVEMKVDFSNTLSPAILRIAGERDYIVADIFSTKLTHTSWCSNGINAVCT